jgi:hypothetical protein
MTNRVRGTVRRGGGCQRRATWAETVAAGGIINVPVVFGLLGLRLTQGKGVHRSRNQQHR